MSNLLSWYVYLFNIIMLLLQCQDERSEKVQPWRAENPGKDVRFNLMFQYRPECRAFAFPEIDRALGQSEIGMALTAVKDAGLSNIV